ILVLTFYLQAKVTRMRRAVIQSHKQNSISFPKSSENKKLTVSQELFVLYQNNAANLSISSAFLSGRTCE
ncbi:hypothetical protein, partial [Blautia sp.]|uniref:hypothetical protein n=1 Tax=Blautia sp. TaxID=1955243 RepID=UPI00258BFCF0